MERFPTSGVGKLSRPRPVDIKRYGENFDSIFRKEKPMAEQKPFLFRCQRGSLEESMKTVIELKSFSALEDHVRQQVGVRKNAIIEVSSYIKDGRTGWDTHVVTADGMAVGFTNGPVPNPEKTTNE